MEFINLIEFLKKVPAISAEIGSGSNGDGIWWVKFSIDLNHFLAWQTVQEMAHILNYLSVEERLSSVFYPVSPPPYINGGPIEYLSWVIESKSSEFSPNLCAEWLEGRMPNPVGDIEQWKAEEQT